LLIRHVAAVCRVEVTKHGEQDRSAKLRAVIRKGEPVSASLHEFAGGQPSGNGEASMDGEGISKSIYPACRGDSGQRVAKE
jgi:hypothetical protein